MFTKTTLGFAVILPTASGALAARKTQNIAPDPRSLHFQLPTIPTASTPPRKNILLNRMNRLADI
jgi:hypothetical protein